MGLVFVLFFFAHCVRKNRFMPCVFYHDIFGISINFYHYILVAWKKKPENLGVSCKSSKTDLTQKVVEEHMDFFYLMSMYKYYLYEKVPTCLLWRGNWNLWEAGRGTGRTSYMFTLFLYLLQAPALCCWSRSVFGLTQCSCLTGERQSSFQLWVIRRKPKQACGRDTSKG